MSSRSEMASSHCAEMTDVAKAITTMKIGIGAIDHHTLQVESPAEVADIVRQALKAGIPAERAGPERPICGMGREGDGAVAARVLQDGRAGPVASNLVKKELGLPVVESQAADPTMSLLRIAK